MINDYELVKDLIEDAKSADGIIHNTLFKVMNNRPQDEFTNYRKAVGTVIWAIYENIIAPITKNFPDLNPTNQVEEKEIKDREDDIPVYDKEAPPFLERLYHIHKEDGSTVGLNMHFSRPAKSQDEEDWYCTFQVSSELGFTTKKAFGIDGVQALQNALKMAKSFANNIIQNRKATWVGGVGIDIEID
jgi:Domain of unknown function (DUF6968)